MHKDRFRAILSCKSFIFSHYNISRADCQWNYDSSTDWKFHFSPSNLSQKTNIYAFSMWLCISVHQAIGYTGYIFYFSRHNFRNNRQKAVFFTSFCWKNLDIFYNSDIIYIIMGTSGQADSRSFIEWKAAFAVRFPAFRERRYPTCCVFWQNRRVQRSALLIWDLASYPD